MPVGEDIEVSHSLCHRGLQPTLPDTMREGGKGDPLDFGIACTLCKTCLYTNEGSIQTPDKSLTGAMAKSIQHTFLELLSV